MIGIYKYTNKINKKSYIGQSIHMEIRKRQHLNAAYNKNHINYYCDFYKAIREFGIENFDYEILEECEEKDLDEKEVYWINYYNSYKDGYNMTPGGDFNPSKVPEIVAKRTKILLNNPEVNSKLAHKGEDNFNAKLTEQDVKNIRIALMEGKSFGEVYSKYKNKISHSGFQQCWLGKTWVDIMPEVYETFKPINKGGSKRSLQEIYNLRLDYMNGMSKKDLSTKYNYSLPNIRRIIRLERWKRKETIPNGYEDFLVNEKRK